MDGTLLNDQHDISDVNLKAIHELKEHQGFFTLATGREERSVKTYLEKLDIQIPIIVCNGAKLYDPVTKQVIWESTITLAQSVVNELITTCKKHDLGFLFYQEGQVYTPYMNEKVYNISLQDGVFPKVEKIEPLTNNPFTKIVLIGENSKLNQLKSRLIDMDSELNLVYSQDDVLELLPQGISKGVAMNKLIDILGIEKTHTIAIGDNLNDLDMINNANVGVAVSNAHPTLIQKADYVAGFNHQDAVAEVIKKFAITR